MIRASLCLFAILLAFIGGCDNQPPAPPNTTRLTIGNRTYTLEIAADSYRRQLGLMNRDTMPQERGMIFIFPDEQPRAFWMKNTLIPLDILFLDSDGRVVSIGYMEPHTGRAQSDHPARYAIELNAGQAEAAQIQPGDTIPLPDDIRRMRAAP